MDQADLKVAAAVVAALSKLRINERDYVLSLMSDGYQVNERAAALAVEIAS
jgi:predicted ATP-dependent serine protease